jgi:hypothetical protein
LGVAEVELFAESGCRRTDIYPVEIGDEVHQTKQQQDHARSAHKLHEIVLTLPAISTESIYDPPPLIVNHAAANKRKKANRGSSLPP